MHPAAKECRRETRRPADARLKEAVQIGAATSGKQTLASSRRRRIPLWLVKPQTKAKTVQNCSHGCGLYRLAAPSSQFKVVARLNSAKRHDALTPIPSHLKRTVHSSEQPSDAERDCYCRIRLIFDGMAQCLLKGAGGLGRAVDSLAIKILRGIRYFTGPFLAVDISARGKGVLHINAPVVVGVTAYEGTKERGFQTRERPSIETDSIHCVDTPNSKPHLMVARGTIVDADMCIGSFRRCVDACALHIFPAPTHGPFS